MATRATKGKAATSSSNNPATQDTPQVPAVRTERRIAEPADKWFNCGKLGHFSSSCPKLKRPNLHEIEEGLYEPLVDEDYAECGNEEP
jgi:hypothetical protein